MHQEAQKLTITGFPLRSASDSLPSAGVEPAELERRRGRMLALGELIRGSAAVAERELPDEQAEQQRNGTDREDLADGPRATGHAATMKTGVPTSTWVNSHSTCGISIRMQPWEAE